MHSRSSIIKSILYSAIILCCALPSFADKPEDITAYDEIRAAASSGNSSAARDLCAVFLKKHPDSKHIPDVRMVMADSQADPEEALKQYATIRDKYRYYDGRTRAQLRICEIHFFLSQWKSLYDEAGKGIILAGSDSGEFRYFRALAAAQLGKIDEAESECMAMTGGSSSNTARILYAYITRQKSGNSREYIYVLRETALAQQKSGIHPSVLYLIGKFYEAQEDWDRAYSAYRDVIDRYPRSPEAEFASRRTDTLAEKSPKRVQYLPDETTVSRTEPIDIQPEVDEEGGGDEAASHYALAIGPLATLNDARGIRKTIAEFGPVKTARTRDGYMLFLGSFGGSDEALGTRIRLAEEYGINARIVRVSRDDARQYIHGE